MSIDGEAMDFVIRTHDESSANLARVQQGYKDVGVTAKAAGADMAASASDARAAATAHVEANDRTAASMGRLGSFLEGNRSKFRELGSAGRELAAVTAVVGSDFGVAGAQIAGFGNILSDTLLVGHAVADLGPRIVAGILGEGTAAAAATPAVAGLAVAEGAAATAGGALVAALAVLALPVAAGAVALGALTLWNQHLHDEATNAALAQLDHARAMGQVGTAAEQERAAIGEVTAAYASGAMPMADYRARLQEIEDRYKGEITVQQAATQGAQLAATAFHALANSGGDLSVVLDKLFGVHKDVAAIALEDAIAHAKASAALVAAGQSAVYLSGTVSKATQDQITLRLAANDTAAGLDLLGTAGYAAARGMNESGAAATAAGNAAVTAAHKFAYLALTQAAMGNRTATDVRDVFGPTGSPIVTTGGMSATDAYLGGAFDTHVHYTPPTKAKGSNAAANAAAKAAHDRIVAAYETDKTAGDAFYDDLHSRQSQVIDDAHTVANQRIDASHKTRLQEIDDSHATARAKIDDAHQAANEQIKEDRRAADNALAQQLRANAAPVNAAEKALRDTTNQQRERDLNEQLAAARATGDQKQIRTATEAIDTFHAQNNIAQLHEQQAIADQAARDDAQRKKDELDAAQKIEDENNRKAIATEQKTYEANKAAEQTTYEANKAAEQDTYDKRKAVEDARAVLQKKIFDDHIAAMEASKKATEHLAEIETVRYLKDQLDAHGKDDPLHAMAVYEFNKFAKANPDLGLVPARAGGGPVSAGSLYRVNELGTEYFRPNTNGTIDPHGSGSGGTYLAAGAIVIHGAGRGAADIADEVILRLKRESNRQGFSLTPSSTY